MPLHQDWPARVPRSARSIGRVSSRAGLASPLISPDRPRTARVATSPRADDRSNPAPGVGSSRRAPWPGDARPSGR